MDGTIGIRRTSYAMVMVLVVLLTAFADFLFYRWPIGWTMGLFALVVLAGVVWRSPHFLRGKDARPVLVLLGLTVVLAGFCTVRVSAMSGVMLALMVAVVAISCRVGWTWRVLKWIERWGWMIVMPFVRPIVDAAVIHAFNSRAPHAGEHVAYGFAMTKTSR